MRRTPVKFKTSEKKTERKKESPNRESIYVRGIGVFEKPNVDINFKVEPTQPSMISHCMLQKNLTDLSEIKHATNSIST